MLNGNPSLCSGEVILDFLSHSVCTCPVPLIKKDVWHSATVLKTQSPSGRVSPIFPCISIYSTLPCLSLWDLCFHSGYFYTRLHFLNSISSLELWERLSCCFFDVDRFVCLFILGCAGSWSQHTGVCPDAACGLFTRVASPAVKRSREGEGFRISAHGLRCCMARGILQDQGSISCPLLQHVASYPLCHQGSLM